MKKSKFLSVVAGLCLSTSLAWAQTLPKWARYPAISPDGKQIVFTYKGDLYRVAVQGGDAQQLTFHEAHDYMPVWSPDSKQIAFASDRYGNFDIYVMDAAGGEAKRLTYHSTQEYPYSFSPDGKQVLFGAARQDIAQHRQYPTGSQPELYQVPVNGGRVDQILTVPAEFAQWNKDGSKLLYHDKKGGENEFRKHHQSSITRDIWVYDAKSKQHTQLTSFYGEDRHPVFAPDQQSFYYLSAENGTFNVYKKGLDPQSKGVPLTQLKTHPVRSLSIAQDGTLCFSYDGELYTLKEGAQPQKVQIAIRTQSIANKDGYETINGGVRELSVSPDGKQVAITVRGEVFVSSVDGKFTKRLTNTAANERFVQFAPDGKSIVYASERDGRWQIFQAKKVRNEEPFFYAASLIEETPLISNGFDNYQPKFSPDGKKLAFIEDRRTLKVMDLASKKTVTLLTPEHLFHMSDGDQYFEWSPDSKWLLARYSPTMSNAEVVLLDAEGKQKMVNLTKSGYNDMNPKWANGGKQIIWFSNRYGLKSHATSGTSQLDVFTLFLTKEAYEQFQLDKDELALAKEIEKINKKPEDKKEDKKDTTKTAGVTPIKIDWEGIEDRKVRLTTLSSSLSDALLSKDGEKLFYLTRFDRGTNLWSLNVRTKETKMEIALEASGGSLTWDKEEKHMFLLSGGRITRIQADNNKRDNIQLSGEVLLDLEAERQYAFDHVWLRTKKMFYTPSMHGVDWEMMRKSYLTYLPHIGNNYEMAEMLSEMLGELNVSHAGASFSRSVPQADATASLGIFMDYSHKGPGIKIEEIIKEGPLDLTSLSIEPGQIIEKIDGVTIAEDQDVAHYLNRKAGQYVLIEVLDPKANKRQQWTVKPITLGAENQLLYKRWVRKNQAEVEKLSNGTLGYVHISGMNDGQYRNVYEEMMGKFAGTKGVIIDTRFNGGGDLVADLAMFFTGEQFLDYATEDRSVGNEPTFRWTKPTLAMFNEANYSDGHCFSCGYTDLGIGKTVGMPVPGTCSFAGWEGLPNGIRWGTVPISAKNKAGEWLENNETKPTFQVKNQAEQIAKGTDQQLLKAIEELMKDTK